MCIRDRYKTMVGLLQNIIEDRLPKAELKYKAIYRGFEGEMCAGTRLYDLVITVKKKRRIVNLSAYMNQN